MLKKIQLFLAYAFMGQMVCSVLAYGVVLQASHVVLSLMTCVCGVALAFYLHRVLRENREIGLPVDTLFMWDVYFDIMVFLLFIPAWVEDYEEEPWWPIAVTVCMLCAVDFVRQLLAMFSDRKNRSSSRTLLGGYDKSVPRMPESPSYRIRQGNSTTFNVRIAISEFLVLSALVGLFSLWDEWNVDFLFKVLWYFFLYAVFMMLQCCGTRITVEGQVMEITNPYRLIDISRISVREMTEVVISNAFFGCRMTVHYGYGKKAVCYPSDIDEIKLFLSRNRVEVDDKRP